jgi:DNA-binding CsgD family transcriptional regulator/tetratricopeptide (TPR) repeat protein
VVLIGREDELQRLGELVTQLAAGRGRVVWVEGEPGIGKSALIAAGVADAHQFGCQVYTGAAHELLPAFPLQVLLNALQVGPDSTDAARAAIADLLGRDSSGLVTPQDTVAAVAEELLILVDRLCAASPVVLVLDDAHWADEATLGVLLRLGRATSQLPLLLVAAARPVPQRPATDALRRGLADAGMLTIELGALPQPQVTELVTQLVGAQPSPAVRDQLARAGGNPLYVRELVDALARDARIKIDAGMAELVGDVSDVPESLPAAIGGRLSFLSAETMSTLRLAVLFGPEFSVTELSVVTGQPPTSLARAIDEALAAGVLAESADRLVFRHGLTQHALYEGMPASMRAALHCQAAEALAGAGWPVERVAEQLLAAPHAVNPWMVDWLAGAARMLSYRAPQIAIDLIQRIRGAVDEQDPRREQFGAELATALLHLGRNEELEQFARPALAEARDPAVAARIAWILAYALSRMSRHEQAVEVADEGLARPGLPPLWTARLRARQAMSLFAAGRYDAAQAAVTRAEDDGRLADDPLALGYALYTLAQLEYHGRRNTVAGYESINRAFAVLGDESHDIDLWLLLLVNRGGGLAALGRNAEADRDFGEALALAERAGTPPRLAHVRVIVAVYYFVRGRWDEALAELQAAAALPGDVAYRLYMRGVAALVAVHRDDRAAADTHLRGVEDLRLSQGEVHMLVEYLLAAWALAAERDGQPAAALTRLLAVFDPEETLQFRWLNAVNAGLLPDVVRLALAVGEPAVATAAVQACSAEADRQPKPGVSAAAQHCRGLLDADPTQLHAAAATFATIGHPLFQAQALEDAAVAHAERGDTPAARDAYLSAVDIYTSLDAAWDIVRADARLRAHNIRRRGSRRRPATGWEALTPTEQKVAGLIAAGASNRDIAANLFLSRRTVETHVSHILTKLDIRSRVDIARQAATH